MTPSLLCSQGAIGKNAENPTPDALRSLEGKRRVQNGERCTRAPFGTWAWACLVGRSRSHSTPKPLAGTAALLANCSRTQRQSAGPERIVTTHERGRIQAYGGRKEIRDF